MDPRFSWPVASFENVDTWIFDLDDTLYPAIMGIQQQVRERIVLFIAGFLNVSIAEASSIRQDWYERYGAALHGLVEEHGLDPADFLDFVHDIDLGVLKRDETLAGALAALPGRRIVFTNSSARHAKAVLIALGIESLFEDICHIEKRSFVAKPQPRAYECLLNAHGVVPSSSAIFDDSAANLVLPHRQGMRTVLVVPETLDVQTVSTKPPYVDAITGDLAAFLRLLAPERELRSASEGHDTNPNSSD
jgi:putative hydrolase of the HAD superfamily